LALGSFTAEFGMGSGVCLPAIATRPAKIRRVFGGSADGQSAVGMVCPSAGVVPVWLDLGLGVGRFGVPGLSRLPTACCLLPVLLDGS
jgi:hypothetical protein